MCPHRSVIGGGYCFPHVILIPCCSSDFGVTEFMQIFNWKLLISLWCFETHHSVGVLLIFTSVSHVFHVAVVFTSAGSLKNCIWDISQGSAATCDDYFSDGFYYTFTASYVHGSHWPGMSEYCKDQGIWIVGRENIQHLTVCAKSKCDIVLLLYFDSWNWL